jgi:CDP-diglyceride synthetase
MVVVKKNAFSMLAYPISTRLFGANKTWRGFIIMPLAALVGVVLVSQLDRVILFHEIRFSLMPICALGLSLGLAYVLFELPNSFIKRRMGVSPGKVPKKGRVIFLALDHMDSLTGCLFIYWLFLSEVSWPLLLCFVVGPSIHFGVNYFLYVIGVRKEKF